MSLGFHKNDYRKLSSDTPEIELCQWEDDGPPFSDVLESQDTIWDLWDFLQMRTNELSVPIFDEGSFQDFLNFMTHDNPYGEQCVTGV